MISKRDIYADLKLLDCIYSDAVGQPNSARIQVYASKMAVIELCGWIEKSFDVIAERCVKKARLSKPSRTFINSAIKKNHGFDYTDHFKKMLFPIVGCGKVDEMEAALVEVMPVVKFEAELGHLKTMRDEAAHLNISNSSINFDSPSITIIRLNTIHPAIRKLYSWACHL